MKARFLAIYGQLEGAVNWAHREFREFADNLMRDMRSLKALFNYVYLSLYVFLCVWAALYYGKDHLGTAIMTTGGIVGTIFTVYVWGQNKEKEMTIRSPYPTAAPEKPHADEEGASD